MFLAGVCIVGYQGVSYALIGEIAGKATTGTGAMGLMITINAGAATLGTPLFGYIVDRTGSYRLPGKSLGAGIALSACWPWRSCSKKTATHSASTGPCAVCASQLSLSAWDAGRKRFS